MDLFKSSRRHGARPRAIAVDWVVVKGLVLWFGSSRRSSQQEKVAPIGCLLFFKQHFLCRLFIFVFKSTFIRFNFSSEWLQHRSVAVQVAF
jgi:hypothetical protein